MVLKTSVKRIYSASVIDPTGNLWITGGLGEEASDTSEYIDLNADSGSVTSNFGPKLDMGGKYLLILVFTPFYHIIWFSQSFKRFLIYEHFYVQLRAASESCIFAIVSFL